MLWFVFLFWESDPDDDATLGNRSILLASGKPISVNNLHCIRIKNAALSDNIVDFGRTTIRLDYKTSPNMKGGTKCTNKMTLLCSLIPGKVRLFSYY